MITGDEIHMGLDYNPQKQTHLLLGYICQHDNIPNPGISISKPPKKAFEETGTSPLYCRGHS